MLSNRFGINGYVDVLANKIWIEMLDVIDDRISDAKMETALKKMSKVLKEEVVEREYEKTDVQSPGRTTRKKSKRVGVVHDDV